MAYTLEVELIPGWNLISVPRTLADPAIEVVFDGITTVEKVYTYQTGEWYAAFYEVGVWVYPDPAYPVEEIDDGKGYWVYVSEPTTVTITLEPLGYVDVIPPDYPLPEGWSLIGYTTLQLEPQMPIESYLNNLEDIWTVLYRYEEGYEIAKPDYYPYFDSFERGIGYWIYLNAPGALVP